MARLDDRPKWLFVLRGLDQTELNAEAARNATADPVTEANALNEGSLAEVAGIELDTTLPVSKAVLAKAPNGSRPNPGPAPSHSSPGTHRHGQIHQGREKQTGNLARRKTGQAHF